MSDAGRALILVVILAAIAGGIVFGVWTFDAVAD